MQKEWTKNGLCLSSVCNVAYVLWRDGTFLRKTVCFALTCFVMVMEGQDDEQMGQDDL